MKNLSNPYAKKRSRSNTASVAASVAATIPPSSNSTLSAPARSSNVPIAAQAPPPPPVGGGGGSAWSGSFSQAFGSVDDNEPPPRTSVNQPAQQPLQQAVPGAAATHEAEMRDRDHHVLLQPHVLYVNTKQRGNGVLQHIRNVPYAHTKMVPDFIMSTTRCALFLSIKYHQLYPKYILRRLGELKNDFSLRVLLVLVDIDDNAATLLYLNKLAVTKRLTLILSWTEAEAARYLETYKSLDGTDASSIQKREQTNYIDQVAEFITASKPCNKTDAGQLLSHFSTVKSIVAASQDELATCPGVGAVKVRKLWDAFHKPFSSKKAAERKRTKVDDQETQAIAEDAKTAHGDQ